MLKLRGCSLLLKNYVCEFILIILYTIVQINKTLKNSGTYAHYCFYISTFALLTFSQFKPRFYDFGLLLNYVGIQYNNIIMHVTYKLRGESCDRRYDVAAIKCIQINPLVFISHVSTYNSV